MRRLSVIDGIFLRTHAGMGTPIALQGLWRTAGPVDAALLDRLYGALRAGPLGRRVVRSGVPGARDRWQPSVRAHPLEWAPVPLSVDGILAWADRQGADLDPRYGPGWRLSAAPLTDGGTIVVLTCSHVLADARGLVMAVEAALGTLDDGGGSPEPDSADRSGGMAPEGDPESDWADAAATWAAVLAGTARAGWTALRRAPSARPALPIPRKVTVGAVSARIHPATPTGGPAETTAAHSAVPAHADSAVPADADLPVPAHANLSVSGDADFPVPADVDLPVPALVLRCPAREWDRVAAADGGTANSLFIWLVANTLWSAGFPDREIMASLPVDTRDEPRIDNDLAMTDIAVRPGDGPYEIRAKSRAAYERRISGPGGLPEETLHLVPDRVAYLLSRGAGERDILCSNIGAIPPALHALGPHDCTGVAARAIHPGLTRARRPRTRVSGYLCRFRDDYLLTLASLDPARLPDTAALHHHATGTAKRLNLSLHPW